MSVQNLIISALRMMPRGLIQKMAGDPITVDGYVMDPNIQILSNLRDKNAAGATMPENMAEIRAAGNAFDAIAMPRRRGVKISDVELPLKTATLKARIYEPRRASNTDPAILFFHQGGLVIMHHLTDDWFCALLADICRAKVITLDYRLCPENEFPAAIEDGLALWDYVHEQAEPLGIDKRRIALAGDSAGGLISSVMCQILRDKARAADDTPQKIAQPAAQLLIYPWVSTRIEETGSMRSCAEMFPLTRATMEMFNANVFPNDKNIDHDWANPLHNENLQKMPPAIIATAGFDPVRDQGNEYAEALAAVGNQVTHYCFGELSHSFLCLARVSNPVQKACEQLARDLAAHLGR
ncbi:MAG: alpha/beta hydrolase [PS1 clade bacterium]|nr:alpha/beta hydrolase [PS1 clade bacterium]MBL6784116.1 alpha/beta hydrolase [PS1 clade bacterium]